MKTESIKADRDDEQGQPHDGGTMFDDRQTIQRRCRQHTAAGAGAAAQSSLAPRASGADLYAWMPGFRAKLSPGSDLIRAAAGKDWLYSGVKEGIQAKNGSVGGRVTGKKAPFFVQQG